MREKNEEYQYVPEGIKRCKRVPKKDPKKEKQNKNLPHKDNLKIFLASQCLGACQLI